jgi:putative nucleotidyltransferase with HDIG domain
MVIDKKHKDFITSQMANLAAYNARRPKDHVYEFHLHSERVAQTMRQLAKKMGYDDMTAESLYWATLPHDIGKMSLPVEIWDLQDRPTEEEKAIRRTHTSLGVEMVRKEFGEECKTSPFLRLMIDIMHDHHETLDGKGFLGKKADTLSQEVRMACICDAFDGWSVRRPNFAEDRDLSPQGVIRRMENEKAGQFDTKILNSFKEIVLCSSKSYSFLL